MSKITFEEVPSSRKVTRFLVLLQVTGMAIILGLSALHFFFAGVIVSLLTLIFSIGVLFWLHGRYQELPLIREKQKLAQLLLRFREKSQVETRLIQEAAREREGLNQAEKEETLELKSADPIGLIDLQVDAVRRKYQELHAQNDAAQRRARASRELLEHEIISFKERLRELAPLTFASYLSQSFASQGVFATLMVSALIVMQVVSSVSTTSLAFMFSPARMARLPTSMGTQASTAVLMLLQTDIPTTAPEATVARSPEPTLANLPSQVETATAPPTSAPIATLSPGLAACIPRNTLRETGQVVGVIDGDTIDVQINNQTFRVRYLGIDTPEQDQALYGEATTYNEKLVGDKTVTLVQDTSDMDSFNRLLRYVIVGDTFVNHELVTQGYAKATAYAPDTACVSALETAQRQAQTTKIGLWIPTAEIYVPPITGEDMTGKCDPSYPGVCIAPAPPDLDCGDIPYRRFQVLPPDPHGFDRDGDGVGCES